MSGHGAYEGEMDQVALFESAVRAAVPTRPDPRIGPALVPRLAEAARLSTVEAEAGARRASSRRGLVARVGIAVASVPLVLAGLAFAGVTMPSPARSAFDSVGITLPNQPSSQKAASTTGHPAGRALGHVQSASPTTKGPGGSKGKSQAAHRHALAQHQKARGKALGHTHGKAIGLNGATPPGQANGHAPSHSNAGGNSASHATTHTKPSHPAQGNGRGRGGGNANGHSK